MMKKLLFLAALGAIILTPVMASAVTSDNGGGSSGGGYWESKVGKPENDPNAPSSYKDYYKDTQKSSSEGGLTGQSKKH